MFIIKIEKLAVFVFFILSAFSFAIGQSPKTFSKMTFNDEFNGANGSAVDTNKWTSEIGGQGWGNQELQYYTNSTENAAMDGKGNLVIRAIKLNQPNTLQCWNGDCQYTSARLITKGKFEQKYGKFEARIKIPSGQGVWSAFWMLGNDIDKVGWSTCGEIDVMENIGKEPETVHSTIHGPGYSGAEGIGAAFKFSNKRKVSDDFHIFAAEWSENKIEFFVDGKRYNTITPNKLPSGKKWVYDHPYFMILNFAVGGPWGGVPDKTSVYPQTMLVDYVRVYQH